EIALNMKNKNVLPEIATQILKKTALTMSIIENSKRKDFAHNIENYTQDITQDKGNSSKKLYNKGKGKPYREKFAKKKFQHYKGNKKESEDKYYSEFEEKLKKNLIMKKL
ncbi:11111_t:CDS:2, partial [Dentiscutata heterogama]